MELPTFFCLFNFLNSARGGINFNPKVNPIHSKLGIVYSKMDLTKMDLLLIPEIIMNLKVSSSVDWELVSRIFLLFGSSDYCAREYNQPCDSISLRHLTTPTLITLKVDQKCRLSRAYVQTCTQFSD